MGTPNAGGVDKNCVFPLVESRDVSGSDALPPKSFVSIRHDDPRTRRWLAEEYAASSTTLVVVKVC